MSGWMPSMSRSGSRTSITARSPIPCGSGIWVMIPATWGRPGARAGRRPTSALARVGGQLDQAVLDPDEAAAVEDLVEVDGRRGVLARRRRPRGPGRTRTRPGTRRRPAATCSRIAAAIGPPRRSRGPSSTRTVMRARPAAGRGSRRRGPARGSGSASRSTSSDERLGPVEQLARRLLVADRSAG